MTVTAQTTETKLAGNGVQVAFAYSFQIPYQADGVTPAVIVTAIDAAGAITTKTYGVDYSITGVGGTGGGVVTMTTAPASGTYIVIQRNMFYTQPTAVSNTAFYPHYVETGLDTLMYQIQQLITWLGRSVLAPAGETLSKLPSAAQRALGYLAFDSSGNPVISPGVLSVPFPLATTLGGTGTSTAFTAGSVHFSGAAGVYSQNNAQFFWDNTNNRLGIGTATPSTALNIYAASGSPALQIQDATSYAQLYTNGGTSVLLNAGAGSLLFFNNGSERMRIASAGNVGIGTSSPGYLFTVSGTSSLNGILIDGNIHSIANSSAYTISGGSVFNNGGAIQLFGSTSTPAGALVFQTDPGSGSNERLRITGSGEIYMAAAQSPTQTYNVGYLGLPQSGGTAKTVNYACVLSDAGQHIWSNSGLTVTIPANSSVAYPVGTTLTIMNAQTTGNVTIAITTDTLYLANTAGTSGSRTLAPLGVSTAIKVGATVWVISGNGLT